MRVSPRAMQESPIAYETSTGCSQDQFYLRLAGDHPEISVPLDPNEFEGGTRKLADSSESPRLTCFLLSV